VTIDSDLFAALSADSGLTALIGSGSDCRLFPEEAEQTTAHPLVVYTRLSGNDEMHLKGPTGSVQSRYQFSCWGETFDSADAVATALRAALFAASGLVVTACDVYSGPVEAELKLYHRIVDISLWSAL